GGAGIVRSSASRSRAWPRVVGGWPEIAAGGPVGASQDAPLDGLPSLLKTLIHTTRAIRLSTRSTINAGTGRRLRYRRDRPAHIPLPAATRTSLPRAAWSPCRTRRPPFSLGGAPVAGRDRPTSNCETRSHRTT